MRIKSIASMGAALLAGLTLSACVADGGYYGYYDSYYSPGYVAGPVYAAPYYSRDVYRYRYYDRYDRGRYYYRRGGYYRYR
ncbi:hypothetical protein [Agaricicola taiwanensis]|nr:hypothetical protein [Agaricicola taiwanensis]